MDQKQAKFSEKSKLFVDSLLVAMDDRPSAQKNPRIIKHIDAKKMNENGFGIFVTINGFKDRRIKACLTSVNAWAIDLDEGTKDQQIQRIMKSPLVPTMIVESKNGYHVWWAAEDGTAENYEQIVSERLVPFFNADKNAKDICRLLRMPDFYHMKDPASPFLVKIKFWNPRTYTEAEMLKFFPAKKKFQQIQKKYEAKNWDKSKDIDCEEALRSLSGTHWVNGDIFEFKSHRDGTKQIWVNGKNSPCWIDKNGLIGSLDKGGPTIAQWLHWYYKDYKKVFEIMREHFGV